MEPTETTEAEQPNVYFIMQEQPTIKDYLLGTAAAIAAVVVVGAVVTGVEAAIEATSNWNHRRKLKKASKPDLTVVK